MALEKRKSEQEEISQKERLAQIQRMRERLNQHTANQNRDASTKTISENTKRLMQERAANMKSQAQEKGKDTPAR